MSEITYDPEVRAAYIKLSDARIVATREMRKDVLLDFDEDGQVVGIEILDVAMWP